jgi:hypothetical protein
MSRTDKYIAPFSVAGMGLIFLASPLFLNLGTALPSYLASQEISSQQEQQRKELAERKKTSDKIRQTGLPVAGDTLFRQSEQITRDKAISPKSIC